MKIIKEYCPDVKRCVIRTNTYGHSFDFLSQLVVEAKKDVPGLVDKDIEVVQFAGRDYARTYGIEFSSPNKPDDYFEISTLENTF